MENIKYFPYPSLTETKFLGTTSLKWHIFVNTSKSFELRAFKRNVEEVFHTNFSFFYRIYVRFPLSKEETPEWMLPAKLQTKNSHRRSSKSTIFPFFFPYFKGESKKTTKYLGKINLHSKSSQIRKMEKA